MSHNLKLRRVQSPTDQELDSLVNVMSEGFGGEAAFKSSTLKPSVIPSEFARARCMEHLGPALLLGEIWVASQGDGPVLGLAVWYGPGHTKSDTEEQRRFAQVPDSMRLPEQSQWRNQLQASRKAELEQEHPSLAQRTYYLDVLVTVPAARGKGVGGSLIREAAKRARSEGTTTTLLTVTEPNRRFYEGQGFKTIWERETVYLDGAKEPYIIMEHA